MESIAQVFVISVINENIRRMSMRVAKSNDVLSKNEERSFYLASITEQSYESDLVAVSFKRSWLSKVGA